MVGEQVACSLGWVEGWGQRPDTDSAPITSGHLIGWTNHPEIRQGSQSPPGQRSGLPSLPRTTAAAGLRGLLGATRRETLMSCAGSEVTLPPLFCNHQNPYSSTHPAGSGLIPFTKTCWN